MQESVEEIDAEEAQVSQSLQKTLHAGIADLRDLAGVQGFTKTDIHIIFMQSCVRSKTFINRKLASAGQFHGLYYKIMAFKNTS